jgi:hypothetical protein
MRPFGPRRIVTEGIEIMRRLEHRGALDRDAQDTLNKLNEPRNCAHFVIKEIASPKRLPSKLGHDDEAHHDDQSLALHNGVPTFLAAARGHSCSRVRCEQ